MTARLLILLMALLLPSAAHLRAQSKGRQSQTIPECGFDPIHQQLLQEPDHLSRQQIVERQLYQRALAVAQSRRAARNVTSTQEEILTIPVVIHIIHLSSEPNPGDGLSNPTNAQILTGLDHLNQAYRNMGEYGGNGHNTHTSVQSVDTGIEFCLAQTDIYGNPTSGILRYSSDEYSDLQADLEDPALQSWVDKQDEQAFPVTDYAHVWLVNKICRGTGTTKDPFNCNIGGYAYYPATLESVYNGVVALSYLWGTSVQGSKNHIHEFGHYLGLYHTFQGGCPNGDCLTSGDRICDTPPDSRTSFSDCGSPDNSCFTDADDTSNNNPFTTDQDDLYENYMDYTSKYCQNTFTRGQADRMRSVLLEIRHQLLRSIGCASPTDQKLCSEEELVLMDKNIAPGVYDNATTISAGGEVQQSSSVIFHASESIKLMPGFRATKGSSFSASLQECRPASSRQTDQQPEPLSFTEPAIPTAHQQPMALQVLPNPVRSRAEIRYYLPKDTEMANLVLSDVNGRAVRQFPFNRETGWQQQEIDVQDLSAGIYILRLRTNTGALSRQVIVQ